MLNYELYNYVFWLCVCVCVCVCVKEKRYSERWRQQKAVIIRYGSCSTCSGTGVRRFSRRSVVSAGGGPQSTALSSAMEAQLETFSADLEVKGTRSQSMTQRSSGVLAFSRWRGSIDPSSLRRVPWRRAKRQLSSNWLWIRIQLVIEPILR